MAFGSEQDPLLFVWNGPPAVNSLIIADMIFSFFLLELEDDTLDYASLVDQLVECGVWKDDNHENMSSNALFAILGGLRMESFCGDQAFQGSDFPKESWACREEKARVWVFVRGIIKGWYDLIGERCPRQVADTMMVVRGFFAHDVAPSSRPSSLVQ